MDLRCAGLWYTGPDRLDPGRWPSLTRRPWQTFEAYKAHIAAMIRIEPNGKPSILDETRSRPEPSVVVVGADAEVDQVNAWLEVLCEAGWTWQGQLYLPPADPDGPAHLRCSLAPWCPHRASVQLWCPDCWNRIVPEVQRGLIATYREQQAHTGANSKEWMAWAQKTPSLRSPQAPLLPL